MTRGAIASGVFVAFAFFGWYPCHPASAQIICEDDITPEGMAVITTGTSPTCAGSCSAREIKPVCGPVIKICAGQSVPKGYVLDSITTTPGCACLGAEDNAYVIRYVGMQDGRYVPDGADPYLSEEPDPSMIGRNGGAQDSAGDFGIQGQSDLARTQTSPYGDPPFGNVLCASPSTQPETYSNPLQYSGPQARENSPEPPPSLNVPANIPAPPPSWNSLEEQSEPFRAGQ
jgi:hypothetical protein